MFKEVTPVFADRRCGGGVRFSVRLGKKGAATGFVAIPQAALDELGWREGDRLRLLLGEREDEGVIRLEKAERGAITLGRLHRYEGLSARLGSFKGLPSHAVGARNAIHEVKDGGLEVDLPLPEEEAQRQSRPEPPRPVVSPMAVRPQPASRPPLRDPR